MKIPNTMIYLETNVQATRLVIKVRSRVPMTVGHAEKVLNKVIRTLYGKSAEEMAREAAAWLK